MSICPAAFVLCHFWHLADLCPRSLLPAVEGSGMVVYHSYLAPIEGGHPEQSHSAGLRARHGDEFCSYNHFRHRDGIEVWQKPPCGRLLPCRGADVSIGCCSDLGLDTMTLRTREELATRIEAFKRELVLTLRAVGLIQYEYDLV